MFITDQYLRKEQAPAEKPKSIIGTSLSKSAFQGLIQSRFIRAFAGSATATGIFVFVSKIFLNMHLAPWMYIASITSGYGVALLIQMPCKGLQKMQHEVVSGFRKMNYNSIWGLMIEGEKRQILLGSLPNRLSDEGEKLVLKENVRAVLSINEPWEREPQGRCVPYTEGDWWLLGIQYKKIDADDHKPLTLNQLDTAAEWIHQQFLQGNSVYIHCRAGCGRSNMAVAAYLVRYHNFTVAQAASWIKEHRAVSTIKKSDKLNQLEEYVTARETLKVDDSLPSHDNKK